MSCKKVEKILTELETLLMNEKKLLLMGIKSGKEAEEIEKIEKKKLEILSKIANLSAEELAPFKEKIKTLNSVNSEIKSLLINNLNFLESIIKELFPEENVTYGKKKNKQSLFNKKI